MTTTVADVELAQMCDSLDLTDEARSTVQRVVQALRLGRTARNVSGPAYRCELLELKDKALALRECLAGLSVNSVAGVGFRFVDPGRYDFEWHHAIGDTLDRVVSSIDAAHAAINPQQLRTGRKEIVTTRALLVLQLRRAVCRPGGINFARSGKFKRLCDAVFAAGGVHPSSASAIDRAKEISASGVDVVFGWKD